MCNGERKDALSTVLVPFRFVSFFLSGSCSPILPSLPPVRSFDSTAWIHKKVSSRAYGTCLGIYLPGLQEQGAKGTNLEKQCHCKDLCRGGWGSR